jgi:hypothetical protein
MNVRYGDDKHCGENTLSGSSAARCDGLDLRPPVPALQQPVLDQSCRTSVPRVVGAHAKTAILIGNDGAGPGIADLEPHRVLRTADPLHDADKGLLSAELQGDGGICR